MHNPYNFQRAATRHLGTTPCAHINHHVTHRDVIVSRRSSIDSPTKPGSLEAKGAIMLHDQRMQHLSSVIPYYNVSINYNVFIWPLTIVPFGLWRSKEGNAQPTKSHNWLRFQLNWSHVRNDGHTPCFKTILVRWMLSTTNSIIMPLWTPNICVVSYVLIYAVPQGQGNACALSCLGAVPSQNMYFFSSLSELAPPCSKGNTIYARSLNTLITSVSHAKKMVLQANGQIANPLMMHRHFFPGGTAPTSKWDSHVSRKRSTLQNDTFVSNW